MATYEELAKFKNEELAQMRLTNEQLSALSWDQLLDLAKLRIERFEPKNERDAAIKAILYSMVANLLSMAIIESAKIDWSEVLQKIILFF